MISFVVTCSVPRPLPSAVQLFISASTPTPVGYPLCFDNDPFCLSPNPFLLITIWIAYVRNFCSSRSPSSLFYALASLFRSLAEERNASPIVSTVCSLFAQNNRGVPQLFFIPRSPSEGLEWYSRQAPSKQPRLLRPFARNLFKSRIMFPQRLRHFHLLALQRRDQLQRIHHRFPFIMIVRNHINFPRRLFQFLHALGPRVQLLRRVQIVVPLMRRQVFIVTEPSIVPAPMQPHISHRRSRLLRRAHRPSNQRLINVAKSRV